MHQFKLYPYPEKSTLSLKDYGLIMQAVAGKKRILEIGPGLSTYALIEAGAEEIVTLEHEQGWFDKAVENYKAYPQVKVLHYGNEAPVAVVYEKDFDQHATFDIALVDSPKGFSHKVVGVEGKRVPLPGQTDCSRLNTCLLALKHAPIVLLHDAYRPLERGTLGRLSALGHEVNYVPGSKVGIARIIRDGKNQTGFSLPGAV